MTASPDHVYDELLVLRCQDGDRDALDELVGRWQKRLFEHARRLIHHHDAAWDAVQESWVAIVRGIGRLEDPASFRHWAYRIVTYKCTDWIRRQQRQRRLSEEVSRERGSSEAAPPDETDGNEEIEHLRRALQALPGDRQAILSFHYLEGLAIAEIAKILAIPEGTVKSRLYHARLHLKNFLEREDLP